MTEREIGDLLAKDFAPPHWGFLRGVRNAPGFPATLRTADAIAMGLWPSRGLELHGFEIKSYRQDWKKELAHPEKAEEFFRFCDRWWIVAPEKIVLTDEVPMTWGHMQVAGGKLKVMKPAPELKPMAPTRQLLASILRTALGQLSPEAKIKEAHESGVSEGVKLGEDGSKYRREQLEVEVEQWKKLSKEFEEASGLRIGDYRYRGGKSLGEAVRMVMQGAHVAMRDRLMTIRGAAEGIVKNIDDKLNTIGRENT